MNLLNYLKKDKIEELGYDTIYLEKPTPSIIDFDWRKILSPPPKNISRSTFKELELIAGITKKRSKKQIDFIYGMDQDLDSSFIKLLDKYKLEYPQKFIDLFYSIIRPVLLNTKGYWNRPRPYQLAKLYNIEIDVIYTDTHHTASYPSGHTVYSNLVANILKDYYPQLNKTKLTNIVLETAEARVLQGVHYPSDNKASIIFSNFLFKYLNPKLKQERT